MSTDNARGAMTLAQLEHEANHGPAWVMPNIARSDLRLLVKRVRELEANAVAHEVTFRVLIEQVRAERERCVAICEACASTLHHSGLSFHDRVLLAAAEMRGEKP